MKEKNLFGLDCFDRCALTVGSWYEYLGQVTEGGVYVVGYLRSQIETEFEPTWSQKGRQRDNFATLNVKELWFLQVRDSL